MVNYAEEADFAGHKKPKKYLSAAEAKRRREARAAARSEEDWHQYARDCVYRLLGVRDRSEHELAVALRQRDVPQNIASETIAKFVAAGLVDDAKFAQSFVRARVSTKATSRRALAAELQKRGISPELAEQALEQLDPDSEAEAALAFALRKAQSLRSVTPEVARRRLYGALGRRGFKPSDINAAVAAALAELSQFEEGS